MQKLSFFCLFFLSLSNNLFASDSEKLSFSVVDPENETKVFYTGKEQVTKSPSLIKKNAEYYDSKGKIVQKEVFSYNPQSLKPLDSLYHNILTGEKTEMSDDGDKIKISYTAPEQKEPTEKVVSWSPGTIHGKNLHDFAVSNWDKIVSSQKVKFDLIVPHRFERIAFEIELSEREKDDPIYTLRVQPENFFIRQFAPKLIARYRLVQSKPEIVSFDGPTNLPINGESGKMVRFLFAKDK